MRVKNTIPQDMIDAGVLDGRFWSKVTIGDPDACWPFTGCRNRHGYGQFGIEGAKHFAHRVAWALANERDATPTFRVLHSCDNPPCCNPAHLSLGTQAKNVQEMWDRNQTRKRAKPPVGHKSRGEAHHSARLTVADVLEVRADAAAGTDLQTLATRKGVTKQSIWAIVHRKKWKHV